MRGTPKDIAIRDKLAAIPYLISYEAYVIKKPTEIIDNIQIINNIFLKDNFIIKVYQ